jgi:hypothetical protein
MAYYYKGINLDDEFKDFEDFGYSGKPRNGFCNYFPCPVGKMTPQSNHNSPAKMSLLREKSRTYIELLSCVIT